MALVKLRRELCVLFLYLLCELVSFALLHQDSGCTSSILLIFKFERAHLKFTVCGCKLASKQASIHMHVHNAVLLVWGSLRVAPTLNVQGCRPDFNSCKRTLKNKTGKNSFQVITMQCYIQKLKLKSVQTYEFCCHCVQQTHWLHCT